MALPPSIPTSFVPHSGLGPKRYSTDLTGAFGFFCYFILAVVFALALGVFFYGRILSADKVAKDKALATELAKIDSKIVTGFVRLRDRLTTSQSLLDKHVALTGFFAALEKIVPSTVRLDSIHLSVDDTRHVKLEGSGTAKTFNALAVASTQFSTDGRIKDALFSNLKLNKDNSVSFTLTATLDPSLIAFTL